MIVINYKIMPSLTDRALSVYQQEGAKVLLKKTLKRIYVSSYCHAISYIGSYSLSIESQTVRFSAPTPTLVERNRKRFLSEYDELCSFLETIKDDDVVYDVGANTGLYSLFAAWNCQQGKVIAFEPYPPNAEVLRQDIFRNGIDNIELVEAGLSNSVDEVAFSQPSTDDIRYGSCSINTESCDSTVKIPTFTGDNLVNNGTYSTPNVVKIDVEGAEPLVIEGMEEILSGPDCRAVFCEVHLPGVERRPSVNDFGSTPDKVISQLESFGYTTEEIGTLGGSEITIKATM